jgi:hypothetical protein
VFGEEVEEEWLLPKVCVYEEHDWPSDLLSNEELSNEDLSNEDLSEEEIEELVKNYYVIYLVRKKFGWLNSKFKLNQCF